MALISFSDWLLAREDSPWGRTRKAAALGTGPDIPLAGVHSRSTAPPGQLAKLLKKKGRKKKGRAKKG